MIITVNVQRLTHLYFLLERELLGIKNFIRETSGKKRISDFTYLAVQFAGLVCRCILTVVSGIYSFFRTSTFLEAADLDISLKYLKLLQWIWAMNLTLNLLGK